MIYDELRKVRTMDDVVNNSKFGEPTKSQVGILAYAAGIIECSGSLVISRSKISKYGIRLRIVIKRQNEELISFMSKNFGGSVYEKNNTFMWILGEKQAIDFLELIMPYLGTKKALQARYFIDIVRMKESDLPILANTMFDNAKSLDIVEIGKQLKK